MSTKKSLIQSLILLAALVAGVIAGWHLRGSRETPNSASPDDGGLSSLMHSNEGFQEWENDLAEIQGAWVCVHDESLRISVDRRKLTVEADSKWNELDKKWFFLGTPMFFSSGNHHYFIDYQRSNSDYSPPKETILVSRYGKPENEYALFERSN